MAGETPVVPGTPPSPGATPPNTPPVPGSPEHDAAAAAKYDQANTPEGGIATPPAGEPQLILGKFKDQAALEAAYKALEAKLGTPPVGDTKPAPTSPLKAPVVPLDSTQQTAQDAGVDLDSIRTEYMEKGQLSPETYEALAKAHPTFNKDFVDSYIAGQVAVAEKYNASVYEVAGGEEKYGELIQWAAQNLKQEDKVAFNAAIDSRNPAQARLAVLGLQAARGAVAGNPPQLLNGGNASPTTGYASRAQHVADVKNPLYQSDPAFRQMVYNKLAATPDGVL